MIRVGFMYNNRRTCHDKQWSPPTPLGPDPRDLAGASARCRQGRTLSLVHRKGYLCVDAHLNMWQGTQEKVASNPFWIREESYFGWCCPEVPPTCLVFFFLKIYSFERQERVQKQEESSSIPSSLPRFLWWLRVGQTETKNPQLHAGVQHGWQTKVPELSSKELTGAFERRVAGNPLVPKGLQTGLTCCVTKRGPCSSL